MARPRGLSRPWPWRRARVQHVLEGWRSLITGPRSCSSPGPGALGVWFAPAAAPEVVVERRRRTMIRLPDAQALAGVRVGASARRHRRPCRGRRRRRDHERILCRRASRPHLGQPLAGHARDHAADRGRAGLTLTTATRVSSTIGCPASGPSPGRRSARRAAGRPRRPRRANASAVSGVSSLASAPARRLPHTSAGKHPSRPRSRSGVLAAMIQAGDAERLAHDSSPGGLATAGRRRLPVQAAGPPPAPRSSPSRSRRRSPPSASLGRLPVSAATIAAILLGVALEQLGDHADKQAPRAAGRLAGPGALRGGRGPRIAACASRLSERATSERSSAGRRRVTWGSSRPRPPGAARSRRFTLRSCAWRR